KTLGKEKFGLESVTGVVMANEWANLNTSNVMADGKTQMQLADGTTRTLDISSSLEVVGLTCTAYMADQDNNGTLEVLTDELTADAVNNVSDNEGKAVGTGAADQYKSSIQKMASDDGITVTADTEFYLNYDKSIYTDSEILIRYAVVKDVYTWIDDYAADVDADEYTGHDVTSRPVTVNGKTYNSWVFTITPGARINGNDQEIMQGIFYTADRLAYITANDLALNDYVIGEVYVGTTSTVDVSDTLSWNEFVAKYLVENNNGSWTYAYNGESVRVVDNNNDGKAEYVFDVEYTQDKVIGVRNDLPEFYSMSPDTMGGYKLIWDGGVEAYTTGTIANYRLIDNKLTVWQAPVVTDSVKTKNFQKITVTTTESGETYGQSGIYNYTRLSDRIMSMDDGTKYNMYLDQFGFIRTYELAQGYEYALLTEMYGGSIQNSNYVTATTALAELTIGDADTKEYTVNGAAGSVFLSRLGANDNLTTAITWTMGTGLATGRANWLQPAIAHLEGQGQSPVNYGNVTGTNYAVWGRQAYKPVTSSMSNVNPNPTAAVFDYGKESGTNNGVAVTGVDNSYSFTNVANYVLKDDGTVDLKTASTRAYDKNGRPYWYVLTSRNNALNPTANMDKVTSATWDETKYGKTFEQAYNAGELAPVYAIDYVQLTKDGVTANQRHFNIADTYNVKYNNNSNGYVNATVNTEFYIVTPSAIKHVVGYAGLPTILASNIRAAYAVATNTNVDSNGADYWVADVIVIETNKIEQDYDSISLFYWNPSETQGQVRYIDTLNNEWSAYGSNNYAKMQAIPGGSWGNWSAWADGYGFYELYNTQFNADGNSLTTAPVSKIVKGEYNDHGIYAGALRRDAVIADTSGYVSVNLAGNTTSTTSANITAVDLDAPGNAYSAPVYHVQYNQYNQTVANEIRLVRATWTDVQDGDALIWVLDKKSNTAFVVDVTSHDGEGATPAWLGTIYTEILEEQAGHDDTYWTLTVTATGLPEAYEYMFPQTYKIPKNNVAAINFDMGDGAFQVPGYAVTAIADTTDASATSKPTVHTPNDFDAPANTRNDMSVELTYAVAQYTLTVAVAGTNLTNANQTTVNKPVAATPYPGTAVTYNNGETYVVTVPATGMDSSGFTAAVTGLGADTDVKREVDANGNTIFTGKITANTTLTITEVDKFSKVVLAGGNVAGAGTTQPDDLQYAINGVVQMTGVNPTALASGDYLRSVVPGDKVTFTRKGVTKIFFVDDPADPVTAGTVCTSKEPVTSYVSTLVAPVSPATDVTITFYEPIAVTLINSVSPETGAVGIAVDLLGNSGNVPYAGDDVSNIVKRDMYIPYGAIITGTLTPGGTGAKLNVTVSTNGTVTGPSVGADDTEPTSAIHATATVNFGVNA
ncbi:MAG: hypothetical protein HDT16_12515, partial [Oscillibacter sp.]|nr:hypothetical protein [Oscillibacter sp.]